jgi:5-methylthioadenosine/S-adenosylhomocysteine deaminase
MQVLTMNDHGDAWARADIVIRDSEIEAIGPDAGAGCVCDRTIEGRDLLALPGFVNTHTHLAMTLLRGYADDMRLMPWLQEKIWPAETRLRPEDVYWGSLLGILESLRAGVTTFTDMYHHFDATAQAVVESGIRACLSGVVLGMLPGAKEQVARDRAFVETWQGAGDGRITAMIGPHAPYTCPDDILRLVLDAARATSAPLHIHLSETRQDIEASMASHGVTPVQAMEQIGLFDVSWVVAAHCVHLTDEDIDILATRPVGVAHCPGSNMKLASGVARLGDLLDRGAVVGLGTDGAASNNNLDLLEEARLAALQEKIRTNDPTALSAPRALALATRDGARALRLGDQVGMLAPGMKADVIVIDTHQPHLWPQHDMVSHLVYAARSSDVCATIVNGELLYDHGEFPRLDHEKIMAEAAASAARLMPG